jgi:PAS domain S-box-containing protein
MWAQSLMSASARQAAFDGVVLVDARGHILMFNPACEQMFGYQADDMLGQHLKLLMPPPYCEEYDRHIGHFHQTGECEIISACREVIGMRKDRSTFVMDLSLCDAKQDGPSMLVGVIHDLTYRGRVEQASRAIAARLEAVVNTAVDGVILIDVLGEVLMFNLACERLFGYRADEMIGQSVKLLMPWPYREEYERNIDSLNRTGRCTIVGTREVVGLRKDGSTFPMDLSVGEAKQDGESTFVGVIHDLTEHKRTGEQLVQAQKMETVGRLSGGIAHDFNNLLTVIVGNAEFLREQLTALPDLQRLAGDIGRAGDRGAELTQRLLAFSRRQTLSPVEFDCNTLLDSTHKLLWRTLREDIAITTAFDPELASAFADPAQLESAVLNLALNAQDAMPAGGRLSLTTANVSLGDCRDVQSEMRPGQYVLIAMTDNGEGMTKEVLDRAFEPFFTTKDVGQGSGLGLSMVYGFAKQSNGHVAIYSEPGLGTTVRIYLPAALGQTIAAPVCAPMEQNALASGRETVLVVEDDQFVRSYAVNCLESLGYRTISAIDGADALQKLANGSEADVLFTDIVMPGGISGWELAERAVKARPDLHVLLTSGYALETLAASGRLPAGVAILNKPYRKADLARRLREVPNAPRHLH